MQRFKRIDRVSQLIHREVSDIIDNHVRDPRIGMVTVTGVEVARDMKYAKVFVSVLAEESDIDSNIDALNQASAFIRSILSQRISLKFLPELSFYYYNSTFTGMRIDKILREINHSSE